jgi:hypothetical protein
MKLLSRSRGTWLNRSEARQKTPKSLLVFLSSAALGPAAAVHRRNIPGVWHSAR